MSAAITAADGGLRVLLLDEQAQPGGQIYRNVGARLATHSWLGKDYASGLRLLDALAQSGVTVQSGATVWRVDSGPRVVWSQNGISQVTTASHILLASGAQERPVPFPGWTLPGVMTAGAAQILMKTAGMLPKDAVLAGSGPRLWPAALSGCSADDRRRMPAKGAGRDADTAHDAAGFAASAQGAAIGWHAAKGPRPDRQNPRGWHAALQMRLKLCGDKR